MAARSIASLSLSFGLVSIPVKVYSATESSSSVSFNMLHNCGSRVKQQYLCIKENIPVERADMVKGYEFEKDRYVIFTAAELKALEEAPSSTVDIVSFIPLASVDPIFFDKAYYLAPDKRGAKPYGLLLEAMRASGRCALARWAWKGKQYVVQVRPGEGGLILQQLLYAEEVRSMKDLEIEKAEIQKPELQLALQLIDQISADSYDPREYQDEEKKRILAAIDDRIAGKQVVATDGQEPTAGAQVIDLVEALRASLAPRKGAAKPGAAPALAAVPTAAPASTAAQPATTLTAAAAAPAHSSAAPAKERKAAKRAPASAPAQTGEEAAPAPARTAKK
jgi:DNA end-binding protein Ku